MDCMHLEDQPSGSSQVTDSHRSSRQGSRGNGNPIVIGVNTMSVLCTICFDRWERMVIAGAICTGASFGLLSISCIRLTRG